MSDLLVRHGIVQEVAVEDPEGYDGGRKEEAIAKVEAELGDMNGNAVTLHRQAKEQKEVLEREVHHLSGAVLTD